MIGWLLRYFVLMSLLLPGAVQGIPVGELTNAAGERVGMQDIPEWGDAPGKIHRLYCAGPATLSAIYASTLTPNGIKSDRRMPAYERLDVRCVQLRASWKTLPQFAQSSKELAEVKATLEQVSAALATAKAESSRILAELQSLKTEVKAVPQTVLLGMPVVPSPPPWWQEPVFWMALLLILLMLALLLLLIRMRRNEQFSVAAAGARTWLEAASSSEQQTPLTAGGVWSDSLDGSVRVVIAVRDMKTRALRLFIFVAPRRADGSYWDVTLKPCRTPSELTHRMGEVMQRYVTEPKNAELFYEFQEVEDAKSKGMLVEMPLV